jgi:acetoin utilization deacetylase AcuC-like enzyme
MTTRLTPVFHSSAYNDTGVAFDTTRKADAIALSLMMGPIQGIRLLEPAPVSIELLTRVHDAAYVDAVRTGDPYDLAASAGLGWDDRFFGAVCASTGGVCAAVEAALVSGRSGSLSSGLHHAKRGRGSGYCTFNGLVVGAVHAQDLGAQRVLIIDFDAHCGGGTGTMIEGMSGIEQIDVSVNLFDLYSEDRNSKLWIADGSDYMSKIRMALDAVENPETVDLVLYNAGMDPHELAGGVAGIDTETLRQREQAVYDWASALNVPTAFVLAGGYTGSIDMNELVDLHRLTLTAAAA